MTTARARIDLAQRQAAWSLGIEDGRERELRSIDAVCDAVGVERPATIAEDWPKPLADAYLGGFDVGAELADRGDR